MNDEPRIVQGQIGPIRASDVMRHMAGGEDPRDAQIAEFEKALAERDAVLDQYHKFLVEMQDAASSLSEALSMVLKSLGERHPERPRTDAG